MRPNQNNNKRSRGRGRKPQGGNPNRSLDSNGPDVKIRGTASHIYEKYTALSRDARLSGDYVGAENYQQHAEHYFRLMAAAQAQAQAQNPTQSQNPNQNPNPNQNQTRNQTGGRTQGSGTRETSRLNGTTRRNGRPQPDAQPIVDTGTPAAAATADPPAAQESTPDPVRSKDAGGSPPETIEIISADS